MAGGLAVVIRKQLQGGLFDLYETVPGILLSLAEVVLVSLADRPPAAATRERFDRVWTLLREEPR